MTMSENKIISKLFVYFFVGIYNQPFFVFSEKLCVFCSGNHFVFYGQIFCQTYANIRMQPPKQPFRKRIGKYFFHSFIAVVSWTQTISVSDKKRFFKNLKLLRFVKNRNTQFVFKIIFHPQIVISHKKVNRQTAVTHLC